MKNIGIILFLLALSAVQGLQAQNDDFRKKAPEAGPAPRIEMGDYEQFTLENGLQVIVVENHKLPRVSFQLLVDVPPIKEGEFAGAGGLAGEMLGRGTESRTKAQIDEAIDFIGADFSTDADGMFGACLTKHQDKLLDIMADVLLHSTFPEEEFTKVQKQRLSELAYQKDNADFIAGNVSEVLRYGKDHPYGEIVTEQSLQNITVERCKAYYATYFKPNIAYLAIVGDVNLEQAKKIAEKYFGKWEKGEVSKEFFKRPEPPAQAEVDFVDKPGAVQSAIRITYPVNLKPGSQEAVVGNLVNTILGDGGLLGSRLNGNIREDKGYSYGVSSTLMYDKYIGYFSAGGSVRNEVTDSAIVEFLYEMNRLRDEPVSDTELASIKNYIYGKFARALERPQQVASFALNTARYKLPADYYATYLEKTAALGAEDVQKGARQFLLPGQAHIVVVGNKEEVADKLGGFSGDGKVHFFDNEGNSIKGEEATLPEGLTAIDVVENYLSAIGGRSQLSKVQDLSFNMTTSVQGMAMEMSMQRKAPNKMLMTVMMNGAAINTTRFDGEQGLVSAMGQEQKLEGDALESMKQQAVLFPEMEYNKKGFELALAGIEMVEGSNAYRIDVTYPSGIKITEYFDIQSGLKVRTIISQASPAAGEVTVTTDYGDYREVENIRVPFEVKSAGMGPFPITLKVESVEINKGLEDSIFKVE
ncbi:MAG: insulinase family protein [Phaeodactylibacter sp.]|nr:insulinase family protein [Phaeodactylibacter sp.]MCB9304146.1 insulinase family protein [Lewinellaceae bacterium]